MWRNIFVMGLITRVTAFVGPRIAVRRLSGLKLSETDKEFMKKAIECAEQGLTHTFPNPAVGCVLVNKDNKIIGSGFHPKAGYPHAEVFALLEAAGHVNDGVAAAKAVTKGDTGVIDPILNTYMSENGAMKLFQDCLAGAEDSPVTAYVTLEPCCHFGKTPPCAASLAVAKATRVVVGFRDPNPRVDGGGVKVLQDAGVQVEMAEGDIEKQCRKVVTNFVKRIIPKESIEITGAMRRQLRALANRKKQEGKMVSVEWGGAKTSDVEEIDSLALAANWMEHLDDALWREELVLVRLNKAVEKKKAAKQLGERIAAELGAHVAQTLGHTVLLYRAGIPPALDLEELIRSGAVEES